MNRENAAGGEKANRTFLKAGGCQKKIINPERDDTESLTGRSECCNFGVTFFLS
jgi:hypothetical protein